jgi:MraZ protein
MFRGRYVHTIDAKGRVSLPSEFRTALKERSELAPFLVNMPDHLALYPHEDWIAYEDRLFDEDQFSPDVQDMKLFMVSGATPCPPDGQGRILIPPALRSDAHLDREVVIAGVRTHIQIWDKARLEQQFERTRANFREITSRISKHGN